MKTLLVVDIQPEYKDYIYFIPDFVKYVNRTKNNVVFLYNGQDTLGMIPEPEYQEWLTEKGVRDNVVYNATFYDKGYAFFRYCIDSNIDTQSIVNLVKFMYEKGVNDSREQTQEFWNEFVEKYGNQNLRDLLEYSDDMLYMPDLMDFLTNYDDIILCGGGNEQCLKEVEICLMALGKKYKRLEQYIYEEGGNIEDYEYTIGGL